MSADDEDSFTEEVSEPTSSEGNDSGVTLEDFVVIQPTQTYIFMPCREPWLASSINALLPPVVVLNKNGKPRRHNNKLVTMRPTTWLDRNRGYTQMAWAPGFPMRIENRLLVDGGWIERKDVVGFNLYQPPKINPGNPHEASPWIDHVRAIYPDEADHIIMWCAHRVQRPGEKVNHALVLGGAQGIGKDTFLEPLKYAVGYRNFHDIGPTELLERFNEYAKSVILRISEARDLGESNRFAFYDHIKRYTVTPPGELRVNEKHLRPYYIINCVSVIVTTNHKTDGIHLPPDDRRHFVAWSNRTKEDFAPDYWNKLWGWYYRGGFAHVAAYLAELDLTAFDPKAPPPKTAAFWDIVHANSAPEDAELADVIDALSQRDERDEPVPPDALMVEQLIAAAPAATAEWLLERRNRRAIPHRLERAGYVFVRGPSGGGRWRIGTKTTAVYARGSLSENDRQAAARRLQRHSTEKKSAT